MAKDCSTFSHSCILITPSHKFRMSFDSFGMFVSLKNCFDSGALRSVSLYLYNFLW